MPAEEATSPSVSSRTNGPICPTGNIPNSELGHRYYRKHISNKRLEEIAVEKYRKCGKGIDFTDVMMEFPCSKSKAQLKLKNSCLQLSGKNINIRKPLLFRIPKRTKPQQFFPNCLHADIMEDLNKRKNVLIETTGVNLSKGGLSSSSKYLFQTALNTKKLSHFWKS